MRDSLQDGRAVQTGQDVDEREIARLVDVTDMGAQSG